MAPPRSLGLLPLQRLVAALGLLACAAVADDDYDDLSWTVMCSKDCGGVNTCEDRRLCSGEEVQHVLCDDDDRKPCPSSDHCTPTDCIWHEWTAWVVQGSTGLCNRTRYFTANKCGGSPCLGRISESKFCPPSNMDDLQVQNCELGDWGDWQDCNATVQQSTRSREIKKLAANGGRPCNRTALQQTQPCGESNMPQDCKTSDWMAWSGCSESCDGGQKTRLRSIMIKASNGGKPCSDGMGGPVQLQETLSCNAEKCTEKSHPTDCVLSDWTSWTHCTGGASQIYRHRQVETPSSYGGVPCSESLSETAPCESTLQPVATPVDCVLQTWQPWSLCDRTCDGGQTFRKRLVRIPAQNGGAPCQDSTMETMPCNSNPCHLVASGSCQLSAWSEWSVCSADCGQGVEKRVRGVAREAQPGGSGCNAQLSEVRPCQDIKPCAQQDCVWGDWSEWDSCTRTCGRGNQKRLREIATKSAAGGLPCQPVGSTEEVRPCSMNECEQCVDGEWANWQAWTSCTRTCGGGMRWRHRPVLKEANYCGAPPVGLSMQVEACSEDKCPGQDADCEMAPWSQWGDCSKSCNGLQSRYRHISIMGTGNGKSCVDESLADYRSCNGPDDESTQLEACGFGEPRDCQMGEWRGWSQCSKECSGGEQTRQRDVAVDSANGGKPCNGTLKEIKACNTEPCTPSEDCVWGTWTDWGTCTSCDGHRTRYRSIQHYPKAGGQACEAKDSKQISDCDIPCDDKRYCIWSDWQHEGGCSATCGAATHKRIRKLVSVKDEPNASVIVGVVGRSGVCTGLVATDAGYDGSIQTGLEVCDNNPECDPCVPRDCRLSEWTEWSAIENALESGLCHRNRHMLSPANACGESCPSNVLEETKVCLAHSPGDGKLDCEFKPWGAWSGCNSGAVQEYRSRDVSRAGVLGAPCVGHFNETRPCTEKKLKVDCELSDWDAWGHCDSTCGGGQMSRTRMITVPAANGGLGCGKAGLQGVVLAQTRPCADNPCPTGEAVACKLSEWSEWMGCDLPQDVQAVRMRAVEIPAANGGYPCSGVLKETGVCPSARPTDCKFAQWDPWGTCDVTCGGGQRFRTREVDTPSIRGGAPCAGSMQETVPCSKAPCRTDLDCVLGDWSEWSSCEGTCGQGQQERTRGIDRPAKEGGAGCTSSLKEVQACASEGTCDDVKDCKWSDWSDWGDCFAAQYCGIGYRNRTRGIAVQPEHGGNLCAPHDFIQVTPSATCPGQCDTVCDEAEWETWGHWGECSATCGAGVRSRSRSVKKESGGQACGPPSSGSPGEYESCQSDTKCEDHGTEADCKFSDWNSTVCSAKCSGFMTYSRRIVKVADEGGAPCDGPLEKLVRCNPGEGELAPAGCQNEGTPVDCVVDEWTVWSKCSTTCGAGHKTRKRTVVTPPAFGGQDCPNPMMETRMCNIAVCPANVDDSCQWGEWSEWSECHPITGQMTSQRNIAVQKTSDGVDCVGPVTKYKSCTRTCVDTPHTCSHSDWSEWSKCSATCGVAGRKSRKRELVLEEAQSATDAAQHEASEPARLYDVSSAPKAQTLAREQVGTARRNQQLAFAFGAGGVCLFAVSAVVRLWQSRRSFGGSRIALLAEQEEELQEEEVA